MSVYIRKKTSINKSNFSRKTLEDAMASLGNNKYHKELKLNNNKSVSNSYGEDFVDFGITVDKKEIPVGFKFEETLELRGDFFFTGLSEDKFLKDIQNEYMKILCLKNIEKNSNYNVKSVMQTKNGYEIQVTEQK